MKKKGLIISALLLSAFIYSNANASSYTVSDSFFDVSGIVYLPEPPPVFHDGFNQSSSNQLTGDIQRGEQFIRSHAFFDQVQVSGSIIGGGEGQASAFASTAVLFSPNFMGQGDPITFTFDRIGYVHYPVASIEDITAGETIFSLGWDGNTHGNEVLSYAQWNPEHVYRLYMQASLDFIKNDYGNLAIKDNMLFVFAPEPSTLLLFGPALIGLAGLGRKLRTRGPCKS